jgi:hypothetical protein
MELLFRICYTTNRHLSGRGRTDGYMILLLLQHKSPLVLMSYKLLERSPGSSTSFLLLLFKSSFPIQSLIFPVQRRKQQKNPHEKERQ